MLVITNIPNPYRVPLFNELSQQLGEKSHKLKVVFAAKGYPRRFFKLNEAEFEFEYEYLNAAPRQIGNSESYRFSYSGSLRVIKKEKPDFVIVTGFTMATANALWAGKFGEHKTLIWSGTTQAAHGKFALMKKLWRKVLGNFAAGFICYGSHARRHLVEYLGLSPHKMHISFNTVDTSFFDERTLELRLGIPNRGDRVKQLTSISYLTERKDQGALVQLVARLKEKRSDFVLNIIGDGDQRKTLQKMIDDAGLQEHVMLLGHKQKEELPTYLAETDVFLFHTKYDIWGLVLNEAMAAGLPCLSSINAGSSYDLIKEGENGYVVDFNDQKGVVPTLEKLLDDPSLRKKVGNKARETVRQQFNLRASASSIVKALGI